MAPNRCAMETGRKRASQSISNLPQRRVTLNQRPAAMSAASWSDKAADDSRRLPILAPIAEKIRPGT